MHSKEHMCRATRHIPYPRYPTTELWQSLLCHGRCLTVSWRPRFAVDTRRVKRHEVQSAASRRQGPRDGKGFMAKLAMSATCNAKSAIVHTVSLSLSLFLPCAWKTSLYWEKMSATASMQHCFLLVHTVVCKTLRFLGLLFLMFNRCAGYVTLGNGMWNCHV